MDLNEGGSLSCSTPVYLLFPESFKIQKASCCMPSTSNRYLGNDSSLISVLFWWRLHRNPFLTSLGEKGQISDEERDTYRSQKDNLYQKLNYQQEPIGYLPISPFSNYFPLPLWTVFLSPSVHIEEHMASTGTTFAWDRLSLLVGTDLFFRLNSRSSLGEGCLLPPRTTSPPMDLLLSDKYVVTSLLW